MKKMIRSFVSVLPILFPILGTAEDVVYLSFKDVQNIVSQKLVVAQNQHNATALFEAQEASKGKVHTNAVVYLRYGKKESFVLKLEILKAADAMLDKSFDSGKKTKAGIFGSVPWPSAEDRPEKLRGKPLWTPRQNPEDFKDANPDLYVYYKPLYNENIKNTERHKSQGLIRSVRNDVLRDVRRTVKSDASTGEKPDRVMQCRELVDRIILDERLKREILSESAPDAN